jgi:hypothetical protein
MVTTTSSATTTVTTGALASLAHQAPTVVELAHAAHPGSAVDNVASGSAASTQGTAPCARVETIMCGPGHVGHPANAIKAFVKKFPGMLLATHAIAPCSSDFIVPKME